MVLPTLQTFEEPPRSRRPLWIILAVLAGIVALAAYGVATWKGQAKQSFPALSSNAPSQVSPMPSVASTGTVQELTQEIRSLLARVEELERADRLDEAREVILAFMEQHAQGADLSLLEEKAGALAARLVFHPYPMPEKREVIVGPGDSLDRIARRFGTTAELTATNNRIANPHLIKQGDRLRVLNGEFKVVVNKSRNDLLVTLNGRFFKRYRVGTGKFGRTPVGTFVISDRIAEPAWWRPDGKVIPYGDPENILGTRWLALKPTGDTPPVSGYGIHGTWEEDTIGKAESAGCIRLRNRDVEELFFLLPIGTVVVIEE